METLVFTLVMISLFIIFIAPFVLIGLWAYKKADIPLGPNTDWFAKCRPGKFMGVLLGGNLWKWLTNVNGLEIKDKKGVFSYVEGIDEDDKKIKLVTKEEDKERIGHLPKRFYEALDKSQENTFWKKFGIHWVWFRPVGGVLKKTSRWLEWNIVEGEDEKPDSKKTLAQHVKLREEDIWDFSFVKQVLEVAMNIEAGKTTDTSVNGQKVIGDLVAEKIQIDFFAVFTVYLLCPYKSVAIADWLKALKAEWEATCTDYAKSHSVDQIFMKENLDDLIVKKLFEKNFVLLEKYGFVIGNIQYIGAGFSGDNEVLREASNKSWVAEQEAARIMKLADAKEYDLEKEGSGKGKANKLELDGLKGDPKMAEHLLWQRAVSEHKGPLVLGKGSGVSVLMQDTSDPEAPATPPTQKGGKV